MKWFLCALAALLTGCLVALSIDAHHLLRDADSKLAALDVKQVNVALASLNDPQNGIPAILADAHRTELITAGAVSNIEKGTRQWQTKQNQLADQALQDEKNLSVALISTRAATDSLSDLLKGQASSLSTLESGASQSVTSISELSASINSQAGPILESLNQSSANIAQTTASMSASAHDVNQVADRFRDDFLKPRNRAWAYLKAVLGLGSQAGQISVLAH